MLARELMEIKQQADHGHNHAEGAYRGVATGFNLAGGAEAAARGGAIQTPDR